MKKSRIIYALGRAGMMLAIPIFMMVAGVEHLMARIFRLTYNEVNILVYYLLIPLSWAAIIDNRIGFPVLSVLFLLFWGFLYWKIRKEFSYFCDVAFRVSVVFLQKFNRIGWNYVVSSVIICVLVPIIVYVMLLTLL